MSSRAVRRRALACALTAVLVLVGSLTQVASATYLHQRLPADPAYRTAAAPDGDGTGCLVPELSGLRLRAAKTELEWANCRLGRITSRHAAAWKRGYVLRQSVPANSVRRAGFRVGVTIGR